MGCGGSHLHKDSRSQSQVTVAAQQRAEAAYRRQRIALEMEQTAAMRAEMEVERARRLKGLPSDRRPSHCRELVDLREELSDEVLHREDPQGSSRNEAQTSPIPNGHARPEEPEKKTLKNQEEVEDIKRDVRKSSSEQEIDPESKNTPDDELLRMPESHSYQASPSNVFFEDTADQLHFQNLADENEKLPVLLGSKPVNNSSNDDERKVNPPELNTERLPISNNAGESKPGDQNNDLTTNNNEELPIKDEQILIDKYISTKDSSSVQPRKDTEISGEENARSFEETKNSQRFQNCEDDSARQTIDVNDQLAER